MTDPTPTPAEMAAKIIGGENISRTLLAVDRCDLGMAIGGLGFFIDCRAHEGMARKDLVPWMVPYLRLRAAAHGETIPAITEDLVRELLAEPAPQPGPCTVSPNWLPDRIKDEIFGPLEVRRQATRPPWELTEPEAGA